MGPVNIVVWDKAKCRFADELFVGTQEVAQAGCTYPPSHHPWFPKGSGPYDQ